jgi:hypothetical protein
VAEYLPQFADMRHRHSTRCRARREPQLHRSKRRKVALWFSNAADVYFGSASASAASSERSANATSGSISRTRRGGGWCSNSRRGRVARRRSVNRGPALPWCPGFSSRPYPSPTLLRSRR